MPKKHKGKHKKKMWCGIRIKRHKRVHTYFRVKKKNVARKRLKNIRKRAHAGKKKFHIRLIRC